MVYAGASGVGTTLIQLLNHYNYDTYCTVGS
jgi:NADPH:quinone reductase-like Zn-dependent oxidoreductase